MAADANSRRYEAVIFGATGVTGQQVVLQFGKLGLCQSWAIAGRSQQKLEALSSKLSSHIPSIVLADVGDARSLREMAASARLVLNATGPYRDFGEPVVKACLEAKTDYIDLCGEPEFMERMLLEYSDAARDAGAIICHACAFDSVPADLGILHCAQMFERAGGECAHVELVHSLEAPMGYVAHDTTFKAAVHGIAAARDLVPLRKKLDSKFGKVPRGSKALGDMKRIGAYAKDPETGKYLVPFIGSDASVVRSSRRTMAHILNNPASERLMPQFSINFTVGTMYSLAKMALGGLLIQCFGMCKCGRDLLCKYPKFFTFGLFSSEGPTLAQMQNNTWIGDFKARGLVQSQQKTLHVQAKLDDPGYIGTSLLFSVVADTILRDRGSLSASGGVFTPAALFAGSSLLSRLKQRGFEFKVVKTDLDLSGGGA